jgi:glyoxylase-like metal-dependent hydrolase (beta-lactamase superfamily II)
MNMNPWKWRVLRAGNFRLDGGSMFGIIPKGIWSTWSPPDEYNRIAMQTNCLLLENGSRKVLVETGYGNKWSQKERAIYAMEDRTILDALAEIDIDPADISSVILTHLHFDHAGGITRTDSNGNIHLNFPNAEVIVQSQEWEDAIDNRSTMSKTYLKSNLDPIADCVRLVEGRADVLPGITLEPLKGHTWGIQGAIIETLEGTIAFPSDLMPTVAHIHPSASMGYDMLPHQNMLTKQWFLEQAYELGWNIILGHEAGNPHHVLHRDENNRFILMPMTS